MEGVDTTPIDKVHTPDYERHTLRTLPTMFCLCSTKQPSAQADGCVFAFGLPSMAILHFIFKIFFFSPLLLSTMTPQTHQTH